MVRAGGRCEGRVDGVRCRVTHDLRATHVRALHRGGSDDPANGLLLCRMCDTATDPFAR